MKSTAAASDPPGATYYRSLDGLRGLAALMVAYGHAGYFGWVPLTAGSATIGVILFFFLSGFLMAHHYMPVTASGALSGRSLKYWAAFLLRRSVRVYPPYLFAPVVGYLLLMPRMPPDFQRRAQFADLAVFDELIKIATFQGELGIYWTIKAELLFYLLYPLVITLCLLVGRRAWTLLALSLALMVLNHFPDGVAGISWRVPLPGMWTGYLSIFVAGAFTARVARKIPGAWSGKPLPWNAITLISFAALALMVALISRSSPTQASIWQLEWLFAGLFLVMFVGLVRSDGIVGRLLSSRFGVALGRVSYSLYLGHIVAYYCAIKYLSAAQYGVLAAALALLLLVPAYYVLFERPFVQLSKSIAVNGGIGRPVTVGTDA